MIKKYFLGFILRWEMNLLGVEKSKSDNNSKNKINVRNWYSYQSPLVAGNHRGAAYDQKLQIP